MATQAKDYYKVLGVKKSASTDEIRKAYRRLARKLHPDVNPGDSAAEERFKDVQEAYGILNDPKKREMYDRYGFYSPGGFAGAETQGGSRGGFDFGGFDFSNFSRGGKGATAEEASWSGGFSDLFSHFTRGRKGSRAAEPKPGEDLEYAVDIGFWDAIRGSSVRLNVNRHEVCSVCRGTGAGGGEESATCPECRGQGQVNQSVGAMRFSLTCPRCGGTGRAGSVCSSCGGEGRAARQEAVEVRIPAGAQNGSRLRVPRKGNAGVGGAAPGDLYIVTRVAEHPLFQREGDDIRIRVPVTIPEAVLGAKIEVPTIEGKALLKIPPGTSSGKTFRLRERGVMNPRTGTRGDQFVEVRIVTPSVVGENTKELMRGFAELNTENPRADLFESK